MVSMGLVRGSELSLDFITFLKTKFNLGCIFPFFQRVFDSCLDRGHAKFKREAYEIIALW